MQTTDNANRTGYTLRFAGKQQSLAEGALIAILVVPVQMSYIRSLRPSNETRIICQLVCARVRIKWLDQQMRAPVCSHAQRVLPRARRRQGRVIAVLASSAAAQIARAHKSVRRAVPQTTSEREIPTMDVEIGGDAQIVHTEALAMKRDGTVLSHQSFCLSVSAIVAQSISSIKNAQLIVSPRQ